MSVTIRPRRADCTRTCLVAPIPTCTCSEVERRHEGWQTLSRAVSLALPSMDKRDKTRAVLELQHLHQFIQKLAEDEGLDPKVPGICVLCALEDGP